MRKLSIIAIAVLVCFSVSSEVFAGSKITKDQVTQFVGKVSADIAKDVPGTLQKITDAVHPYKNKDNPAFYVFVYDTDVKIVTHPKKSLVGRSYKGKSDVKGKKFRDEIVAGALKTGQAGLIIPTKSPEKRASTKRPLTISL